MDLPETLNLNFIDQQFQQWQQDPQSVSREWQIFFRGFEIAEQGAPPAASPEVPLEPAGEELDADACTLDKALLQSRVEALKYRYRDLGHLLACLDPLAACPASHPLLDLPAFGLTAEDLNTAFYTRRFSETRSAPLKEIIRELKETYCRSVGVEYMHLQDPEERKWLQDRMEPVRNRPETAPDQRIRILSKLCQAAFFESFLHKKYMGQTRFSLEGAEALIPMMDALLLRASENGVEEIVMGMAHRGRLNVLTNVLFKPYEEIFREFINSYSPESLVGSGDVKYHIGYHTDIRLANGRDLRAFLVPNPSHLESVDPVVEGIAYARQDTRAEAPRNTVLPLLLHGDAAFAGQGIVPETLNMSQLAGYRTEGTIHIIINNQIGYTTLPEHARSTRYSTDVAKMLMVPIFHVHGENPEAVVHVAKMAHDYRHRFAKDVIIDLICYRRFGHNEGDEPYFTQPKMYDRIRERPPVHQLYGEKLTEEEVLTAEEIDTIRDGIQQCLEEAFDGAQNNPNVLPKPLFYETWEGYEAGFSHDPVETGVPQETLTELSHTLTAVSEEAALHSKLKTLLTKRHEAVESGQGIDWANAEALAMASLLSEGAFIRMSGQDCGRGTFSQRHAVMIDTDTGDPILPLERTCRNGAFIEILNSPLSETGVLGFEYGYAAVRPDGLTIWEAQFGDFVNNAQSVIDLYIAAGESKWQRRTNLALLLPHGWEGLGPEHSSARFERFLQLCADDNMIVCNPTTPAQYFHLLRRQVRAPWRKPLVVLTPKSLLRHPEAVSSLTELAEGAFQPILPDFDNIEKPKRVIFCSGKIYYQLLQRRETLKAYDMALVRIEQFFPFPKAQLEQLIDRYRTATQWLWVQEGPENMEGWRFIRPLLQELIGKDLQYVGRPAAASPATGFANLYKQEQAALPDQAIGQLSGVQAG